MRTRGLAETRAAGIVRRKWWEISPWQRAKEFGMEDEAAFRMGGECGMVGEMAGVEPVFGEAAADRAGAEGAGADVDGRGDASGRRRVGGADHFRAIQIRRVSSGCMAPR